MSRLPLEGIRITDVTNSWSGPYTTNLLANMGAEVIKVESIQYLDPWRGSGQEVGPPETFWEWSPTWNTVNTDKLSITLDLTQERGAEIFKQLVRVSDVVAENYTPRVMKNFGLDYPVLKEVNSRIIMISLPAQGTTGPWKDYPGYAFPIEQMSGIPQLTGYPEGPPQTTGFAISDPMAGINGMVAVMIALFFRQMTGKGQYIDLSQIEAASCMIGDAIADYSMNKRIQPRRGNHHPFMAPHGYYRCKGDDMWVGIAVSSDQEWRKFSRAIGSPSWTKEEKFAGSINRWRNQDELDKLIEEWTIQYDHYDVMNALQKAGVAAGAILTGSEQVNDPHLKARGTFQMVDRELVGPHPYPVPSSPVRLPGSPAPIRRPAPLLGEHNNYVLGELLGMSKADIQSLVDDQIIGTVPLGV